MAEKLKRYGFIAVYTAMIVTFIWFVFVVPVSTETKKANAATERCRDSIGAQGLDISCEDADQISSEMQRKLDLCAEDSQMCEVD